MGYMAITRSAKKEIRASARRRVFNLRRLRAMRDRMKETRTLHRAGDADATAKAYRAAQKAVDKAAKQGIITKRTAGRRKAVLARAIKPSA